MLKIVKHQQIRFIVQILADLRQRLAGTGEREADCIRDGRGDEVRGMNRLQWNNGDAAKFSLYIGCHVNSQGRLADPTGANQRQQAA